MAGQAELLWRQLPDVRTRERTRFLFFAGLATQISLAQTLGIAGSETLFLARVGASALPIAFIAAALTTIAGSMLYAARVGVARNDDLFVQMLLGAGVLLVLATAGIALGHQVIVPALFCFFFLTQAVFVNHLWTFTGDYFDTMASKRLLPLFTIGASLGGFLGGMVVIAVTNLVNPLSLVAAWALLLGGAAAQLLFYRRRLRRWGPLQLEEADETSVEGIRAALSYVRTSVLGRWLVVSAAGMMLALFVAQYMYSEIFEQRFPVEAQLATFFGVYLAVTNLIEIAIEVRVTPWLIRRFGVATANLLHPAMTLLTFGGLYVQYGLASGIAARVNRELLDNAVSQPIRALVTNAMPVRFRGRVRAFLEGMVVYAGMAVAGIVLFVFGRPEPRLLAAAGAATAVLYLFANLRARRAYLHSIVRQLRTGRLDLTDVGDEIGTWEAARLAELWAELLQREGTTPSKPMLQLIPALAARGIVAPLVEATSHANPVVRRSCVNALAGTGAPEVETCLVVALGDEDASVRLAALRGLTREAPDRLAQRVSHLANDPDPEVRAEAASHVGDEGVAMLKAMLASADPAEATAALRAAPPVLMGAALERRRDPNPAIRAATLDCVARVALECPLEPEELLEAVEDDDARVRRAAVILIANLDDEIALPALGRALADTAADVQFAAETVLGSLGREGFEAARPYLRSERERAVESALRVVGTSRVPDWRVIYAGELRYRVRQMWWTVLAYQQLPRDEQHLPTRFLRAAFEDHMMRDRRLAFAVLRQREDPQIIRKVEKALRFGTARSRGDALEVLSNLGDREAAQLFVLMHETESLEERMREVAAFVRPPADLDEILAAARRSESPWIRIGAEAVVAPDRVSSENASLMDRLLALRQVPLFANLSLEQLEAVLQIATEGDYMANEVIVREGEPGGELYLLIEGKVRIFKKYGELDERLLNTVSAVHYFGEIAILDEQPRSATAVASGRAQMLELDGASLKELIVQMPEISFEIFRELTRRIRAAEDLR